MFLFYKVLFSSYIDDNRSDTERLYDFGINIANANIFCQEPIKDFYLYDSDNKMTDVFDYLDNQNDRYKNFKCENNLYNLIDMCNFSYPEESQVCDNLIREYYENININLKNKIIFELKQFISKYIYVYDKIDKNIQFPNKMKKFNTSKSHFVSNAKVFYKQIGLIKNCKYLRILNYKRNCMHKTSPFDLKQIMERNLSCLDIILRNPVIFILDTDKQLKNQKEQKFILNNYCYCDKCFQKLCLCIGNCNNIPKYHGICYNVKIDEILYFNSSRFTYSKSFNDLRFISVLSNILVNKIKYYIHNECEQQVILYLISLIKKLDDIVEKIILYHCLLNILYNKTTILNKLCRFVIYIKLFYLKKCKLTVEFLDLRIIYMFKCLKSKSSLILNDKTEFKFELIQNYNDYINSRNSDIVRINLLYFFGFLITFLSQKSFFVSKNYLILKFLADIKTKNLSAFIYYCNIQTTIKIIMDNKLI